MYIYMIYIIQNERYINFLRKEKLTLAYIWKKFYTFIFSKS